jgi:hypothetical protein
VSAAVAWADNQRSRVAGGSTTIAIPGGGADLVAELKAARDAKAIAEARAAQFEAERDSAMAARESLRSVVAHLIGERAYLVGQLTRTYERPWRSLKFVMNRWLLNGLSAVGGNFRPNGSAVRPLRPGAQPSAFRPVSGSSGRAGSKASPACRLGPHARG